MQHTRRAYVGIGMLCTVCLSCMSCARGRRSVQSPAMRGDHGVWLRITAKHPSSPHGAPVIITATFENRTGKHIMLPPFDPWGVAGNGPGDGRTMFRFCSRTFVHVEPMPAECVGGPPGPELSDGWAENSWPGMPREWQLISNAIRIRVVSPPKDAKGPRE